MGHNAIDDLSFLYDLPELRILIVADNYITDLTPIASLKHLQYLEVFTNNITDLSPLSGLTELLDLNICYNKIRDVTPLFPLKQLERLWLRDVYLTAEQRQNWKPRCQTPKSCMSGRGQRLMAGGGIRYK